jgi:hypothetical protein
MEWLAQLASEHQLAYSAGVGIVGATLSGAVRVTRFAIQGDKSNSWASVIATVFLVATLPLVMFVLNRLMF